MERANDSKSKLFVTVTDIIEGKINLISERLVAKRIVNVSPADSTSIKSVKSIAVKALYTFKKAKCESNKYIKYRDFIANGKKWTGSIDSDFSADTPAIIVYTSGTTGNSKGVVLSNEKVLTIYKTLSKFLYINKILDI